MRKIGSILKISFIFLGCFWISGLSIRSAGASEIKNLYAVELTLEDSGNSFNQAQLIEQAFKAILVRVSGTQKILTLPTVIKAFAQPDKYVNQFSYHQRLSGERFIKVIFNETLVNQLLTSVNQAAWKQKRPLILLWLVMEHDHNISWLGSNDSMPVVPSLEKIFNERAIPFIFPLLDLSDLTEVSEQAVYNQHIESLQKGSERYHPDAILLGTLKQGHASWEGQWTFLRNGERVTFKTENADLNAFLNAMAEHLVQILMERAVQDKSLEKNQKTLLSEKSMQRNLMLRVSGITGPEHYRKVLEYLQRLPEVKAVEVMQLLPQKTVFELKITTDPETLAATIAEGNVLIKTLNAEDNAELGFKLLELK